MDSSNKMRKGSVVELIFGGGSFNTVYEGMQGGRHSFMRPLENENNLVIIRYLIKENYPCDDPEYTQKINSGRIEVNERLLWEAFYIPFNHQEIYTEKLNQLKKAGILEK